LFANPEPVSKITATLPQKGMQGIVGFTVSYFSCKKKKDDFILECFTLARIIFLKFGFEFLDNWRPGTLPNMEGMLVTQKPKNENQGGEKL